MRTVDLEIPFSYDVVATKTRSRTPQRYEVRSTIVRPVQVLSPSEVRLERKCIQFGSGGPIAHAIHDGRTYFAPDTGFANQPQNYDLATHAHFVSSILEGRRNHIFRSRNPFGIRDIDVAGISELRRRKNPPVREDELRDVLRTDRAEKARLAGIDAADLLVVGNEILSCRHELVGANAGYRRGYQDKFQPVTVDLGSVEQRTDHWITASIEDFPAVADLLRLKGPRTMESRPEGIRVPFTSSRHRGHANFLHVAIRRSLQSVFPNNSAVATVGDGNMGNASLPDDLLEAAFDLRDALRHLKTDLRDGPSGVAETDLAMDRLERFADRHTDATRRSVVAQALKPKYVVREAGIARKWWDGLERPRMVAEAKEMTSATPEMELVR